MSETAIVCETLRDEFLYVFEKVNKDLPVIWIESGLHNRPEKLRIRLQEAFDTITGGVVYLLFGVCGNAALGLKTGDFKLVMPKVDDCISLLIGSSKKRADFAAEHSAYYLTEGWMRGERNLLVEYQYSLKKFGKEKAEYITKTLYGHYKTLALLDTGAYPIGKLVEETKILAITIGLEQMVVPASTSYIEEFLWGPWPPDRYIVKEPHSEITFEDLRIGLK
ncbi:MAG: DUF1638 domain-containing protein [Spirochaetia bacterium]|jgi:hypothetical protein|nr:DUF1638 domain-containing protein [Spirochaetia bacterium]